MILASNFSNLTSACCAQPTPLGDGSHGALQPAPALVARGTARAPHGARTPLPLARLLPLSRGRALLRSRAAQAPLSSSRLRRATLPLRRRVLRPRGRTCRRAARRPIPDPDAASRCSPASVGCTLRLWSAYSFEKRPYQEARFVGDSTRFFAWGGHLRSAGH